jgi:hypothetical protein
MWLGVGGRFFGAGIFVFAGGRPGHDKTRAGAHSFQGEDECLAWEGNRSDEGRRSGTEALGCAEIDCRQAAPKEEQIGQSANQTAEGSPKGETIERSEKDCRRQPEG